MKFTLSWLKQHIITDASADQIANALTAIGVEVEGIVDKGMVYKSFIVAEILEAIQHAEADKLRVCKVSDGKSVFQVVCGAANARAGIKVVLAPVATVIPLNNLT